MLFSSSLIHTRTSHKRVLLVQNYTHPKPTPGTPKLRDQELVLQLLGRPKHSWGGPGIPEPFCHFLTSPSYPQPRLKLALPYQSLPGHVTLPSLVPWTLSFLKGSGGTMVQGPQVSLSRRS